MAAVFASREHSRGRRPGPCCPVCRARPVLPGSSLVRQDGDEQVGVVPASGNMFAGGRQIWLGKPLAGRQVTLRFDRASLHVFDAGELVFSQVAVR